MPSCSRASRAASSVARYSFLGKDPFLVLRQRAGRTIIDRSGVTTESNEPFVTALRRLMAEFQAPFVPGLPRFTGGAVGFIGYDASPVFEPVLLEAWAWRRGASGHAEREPKTKPDSCSSTRCWPSITSNTGF